MPRYAYRNLGPAPEAQKTFLEWIERLDSEFKNHDPDHRSDTVRDALHQLYLGKEYAAPEGDLAQRPLVHSFDPRTATLEPEYYRDPDPTTTIQRNPLILLHIISPTCPYA